MAQRRQLPPQIRRIELARRAGSKPAVQCQLTVDTGVVDGKRKQLPRRYRTEKEARSALAEIQGQVNAGTYVQPSTLTIENACAEWLKSRHKIRPTTAAGYEYVLQPVRSELGELAAARNRQAAEKLALGEAYSDQGDVVCNEAGEPYHPSTLSTLWQAAIRDVNVPQIRLHDARHTCATLMHLQGVPIALVAARLGHADVSFIMRTYVHPQPEALALAAQSWAPPLADPGH